MHDKPRTVTELRDKVLTHHLCVFLLKGVTQPCPAGTGLRHCRAWAGERRRP